MIPFCKTSDTQQQTDRYFSPLSLYETGDLIDELGDRFLCCQRLARRLWFRRDPCIGLGGRMRSRVGGSVDSDLEGKRWIRLHAKQRTETRNQTLKRKLIKEFYLVQLSSDQHGTTTALQQPLPWIHNSLTSSQVKRYMLSASTHIFKKINK